MSSEQPEEPIRYPIRSGQSIEFCIVQRDEQNLFECFAEGYLPQIGVIAAVVDQASITDNGKELPIVELYVGPHVFEAVGHHKHWQALLGRSEVEEAAAVAQALLHRADGEGSGILQGLGGFVRDILVRHYFDDEGRPRASLVVRCREPLPTTRRFRSFAGVSVEFEWPEAEEVGS